MNKKKPYRAPNAHTVSTDGDLMVARFSGARVWNDRKYIDVAQPNFEMKMVEGNPEEIYAKPHNLWDDDAE